MQKLRRLLVPVAAAVIGGCDTTPLEVPAFDPRLDNHDGCVSLAPGVTVSQAASQSDPARTQPVRFTVTFELPVSGFDASDLILGGTAGGASNIVISTEDGRIYTVSLSGLKRNGTVTLSVRSAAAQADQLCNNLTAEPILLDNSVRFVGKSR